MQSVLLDAVSMAPESAFLESVTPAIEAAATLRAGALAECRSIRKERAAGSRDYGALRARGINRVPASRSFAGNIEARDNAASASEICPGVLSEWNSEPRLAK